MYKLENDIICVEIATYGAEVQSIYHKQYKINYLWNGDAQFWGRRSPVLFPIVGRLKNHTYRLDGKTYEMAGHGFARDKEFSLVSQESNKLIFCLSSDEDTLRMYPFSFKLYCEYILNQTELHVNYTLENLDDHTMYYSIGAHPAFSTALQEGDKFEDYQIAIQTPSPVYQYALNGIYLDANSKTLASLTTFPLTYDLFKDDALIFETDEQKVSVELTSNKHQHGVCVSYQRNLFCGIWTPYPKQAPFVCIEPWQGVSDLDDFEGELPQKFAINALEAQKQATFSYAIKVF
ncbi:MULTISPECIES: aldose 1-epimerase family protein [unclassified Granulicatella]|uniref:aldose 1-epimerase family protein n=1 Tax=unclassified Granulicatella TaxID=2630493 RepID=UPI00142FB11D|nr:MULTISPECIES: aldose 1-epimerase family protein [unclassified Granulicatella]MBF0780215.1 aldose 1-epimerase family protein [Granulicatella sp. 19428wC4_WM01]